MHLSPLSRTIFAAKYSRFIWEQHRRERWDEAWDRTTDFLFTGSSAKPHERATISASLRRMDTATSMRLFAMAGVATANDNTCAYNCSYFPFDSIEAPVTLLTISMCGTGVGYSVERRYIDCLPSVAVASGETAHFVVADTARSWAETLHEIIKAVWLRGASVSWDSSAIRPKGAPIKGRGGRSSGPSCFDDMAKAVVSVLLAARGRRITTLEAHDIMCYTARAAAQGDVRQSACIAIFDHDDQLMASCKDPENMDFSRGLNTQRVMANNSRVIERPMGRDEWAMMLNPMFDSYRGEPAIFSRYAAQKTLPPRRMAINAPDTAWGPNPCVEITLRPREFCNLSMAILRHGDTMTTMIEKVRIATIIGTLQSKLTHFPMLSDEWRYNAEDERLLGVDLQGQTDRPLTIHEMGVLRRVVITTNQEWSQREGINWSAATTCGKPGGASHLLHNSSPGTANFRPYPFYIARVRLSQQDPVANLLVRSGVPHQWCEQTNKWAFEFPVASPPGVKTAVDVSAIEHLRIWANLKRHWCEHNPSTTIYYREDERDSIINYVHKHQDIMSGVSFLPLSDAHYPLMPREQITASDYAARAASFPDIDWDDLREGDSDETGATAEPACVNGACEWG